MSELSDPNHTSGVAAFEAKKIEDAIKGSMGSATTEASATMTSRSAYTCRLTARLAKAAGTL